MQTAREFLNKNKIEETEHNYYLLSRYIESNIDYVSFPDADLTEEVEDVEKFKSYVEEFQYLEGWVWNDKPIYTIKPFM